MKIQVLLSTYNGSKYIKAQISSILDQYDNAQICFLIRDDGSTDETRQVLEQYMANFSFRIVFGENIGIEKSVFWLLENRDKSCDLFALCDQDDIWLPNKFSRAIQMMANADMEKPIFFSSQSEIVDEHLSHLGITACPKKPLSFYHAMTQNACPGHTQIINNSFAELALQVRDTKSILVIDWWFYLLAGAFADMYFFRGCLVKHRQHDDNILGYDSSLLQRLKSGIVRFIKHNGRVVTRQLISFRDQYNIILPDEYLDEINLFINSQKKFRMRLKYLKKSKIYRNTEAETIRLKILYAIGEFKIS